MRNWTAPQFRFKSLGMDIRRITDTYAVSPQILPDDIPAIAAAGFTTVLCNRPNDEIPAELHADVMRAAVEAAGLTFVELPLVHSTIEDAIPAQMNVLNTAPGPVLAYCASGTRCSVVWSLGQAPHMPVDDIIAATAQAGYDLAMLRPRLNELAET